MTQLQDLYCLGCKTRHESVEVSEVAIIHVKGSPRQQAKGECPNGKRWTKLLNKAERDLLAELLKDNTETEVEIENEPLPEVKSDIEVAEIEIEEKESDTQPEEFIPVVEKIEVFEPATEVFRRGANKIVPSRTVIDGKPPVKKELVELHREVRELRPQRKTPSQHRETQQNKQSEIQAIRIGRHIGYSAAVQYGPNYSQYLRNQFKKSGLHLKYFDTYAQEYRLAGEAYLESLETTQITDQESEGLSTTTVAGLTAVSIFGAWIASKIKK